MIARRPGGVRRSQQDAGAQYGWRRHRRIGEYEDQDRRRISHHQSLRPGRLQSDHGRPRERPDGGTIGHRFGRTRKLGILFGGSFDYNGRGIDNWQPAIDPTSTFQKPIYDDNTIREYRYYRNRWGFAGTADYKFSDSSSIYLKGLYSNLQDYGDKWYYEPVATSGIPSSTRPASARMLPSAVTRWAASKLIRAFHAHLGSFRVQLLRAGFRRQSQGRLLLDRLDAELRLRPDGADQSQRPALRQQLRWTRILRFRWPAIGASRTSPSPKAKPPS